MKEKIFTTPSGDIHYYRGGNRGNDKVIVFLPGLTADHFLFDKQIAYFEDKYDILVWDAPGHCASRPFELNFNLEDKALWLKEILDIEDIKNPILAGQSMGGYVSQMFLQLFPDTAAGFISIDSAPLKREYMTSAEIWMLKRCEGMYRYYPWKRLLEDGAKGCSCTEYGRSLMKKMMMQYDRIYYSKLAGHGYRILAEALERNLPYDITCPALLICGAEDKAGSTRRYNRKWHEVSGIPIEWIPGAGHNSNTDKPDEINIIIEAFVSAI